MPTPFTHLIFAQRLLRPQTGAVYTPSDTASSVLWDERSAFLLGSVAADARVGAMLPREKTHFYSYGQEMPESPWRVMLRQYPALWTPHSPAQRAFIAGYVGHLAMDELWSRQMVGPYFIAREWGPRGLRYLMLHIILIHMDERDYPYIEPWQADALKRAHPDEWLPFISDADLGEWQHLIYDQIRPGGPSQTLEIFGERIAKTPTELRAILDDPQVMERDLWRHIPQTVLADVEAEMYRYACASIDEYLAATSGSSSGAVL